MSPRNRPRLVALITMVIAAWLVTGLTGFASAQSPSARPASYINPDKGMPTANNDVDAGSSCESPDAADTQKVGDESSGSGNVHNDACLFDAQGNDVDAQVAFQSSGVGVISGCPDPDGDGPKTATKSQNGTLCVLSGFEQGGANGPAGDGEYHARVVSATAGEQTVTFCADPEGDGCANAASSSKITVTWTSASAGGSTATSAVPSGGVDTGRARPEPGLPAPFLALAGASLFGAAAYFAGRRRHSEA